MASSTAFRARPSSCLRSSICIATLRLGRIVTRGVKASSGLERSGATRGSGNVFLDLGFPSHEAAVMLLRCELAEWLRRWMGRRRLTQAQAAERLGVSPPRISEISCNKVDKLSLDYLVGLCSKAGVPVAARVTAPLASRRWTSRLLNPAHSRIVCASLPNAAVGGPGVNPSSSR